MVFFFSVTIYDSSELAKFEKSCELLCLETKSRFQKNFIFKKSVAICKNMSTIHHFISQLAFGHGFPSAFLLSKYIQDQLRIDKDQNLAL